MPNEACFKNLLLTLKTHRFRQLIWLRGDAAWCQAKALEFLSLAHTLNPTPALQTSYLKGCWVQAVVDISTQPELPEGMVFLPASKSRGWLGSEQQVLVLDVFSGFHPDALGALAGTLQAGGLVFLLTPEAWSEFIDPDYQRFAAWPLEVKDLTHYFVERCERVLIESQVPQVSQLKASQSQAWQGNWNIAAPLPCSLPATQAWPLGAANQEQALLVEKLLNWFTAKPTVPVVITANRGRGKSGALGLLLRQLLEPTASVQKSSPKKLLVTAPSTQAAAAIFERLKDLPPAYLEQVSFVAPDALLQDLPSADLLLVDEAAAIPVPVLQALLAAYPRSIFATTQQGYEGNGRGFALRFTQHLNKHTPNWLALTLNKPLRWAEGDPLEKLVNRLLLLDAEVADPILPVTDLTTAPIAREPLSFTWLKQADLAADEALLEQVFGLLVLAHYRTTPDDFRQLLDAPGIHLACAWQNNLPVGLALIQEEGGFDEELAEAIFMGKRRPQGHLLAQSLAFHGGFVKAAQVSWWRIQRILVHPLLQRQGVGKQLLNFVLEEAKQQPKLDLIGSSFGATQELLPFWFAAGYQPVRLGVTRDQASGEHTLQVVQGISAKGQALQQQLIARLAETLPDVLSLWLQALPADLLVQIFQALSLKLRPLSEQNRLELNAFAQGHRPLAVSRTALKAGLWHLLAKKQQSAQQTNKLAPWVQLLLQEVPEQKLQQQLGMKGKKELDRWLRSELIQLLG
ncbi:MAG: tRNA(Met) cytidine acetyltransferase [Pseudomonadaceae bacterium]|nr:tRNA(Met) cytidine acetyltransferase [Pseudomonadaceae bacterium]